MTPAGAVKIPVAERWGTCDEPTCHGGARWTAIKPVWELGGRRLCSDCLRRAGRMTNELGEFPMTFYRCHMEADR